MQILRVHTIVFRSYNIRNISGLNTTIMSLSTHILTSIGLKVTVPSPKHAVHFQGLHRHTFHFNLKECEFRFDHRHKDIYGLVLKMLIDEPLSKSSRIK